MTAAYEQFDVLVQWTSSPHTLIDPSHPTHETLEDHTVLVLTPGTAILVLGGTVILATPTE